ncbi:TIGR00730 family Rossman fold protein [Saccharothrix sp. BKS2]|uniref:LOG family protein n=1 Tax=Saccharothrix sp. BKS2 TaxID=3064400 RepID=UPI0039E87CF3
MTAPAVCVFCSASEDIPAPHVDLAGRTGAAIAARGWTLVSGGERVSMMGAVARGARARGGTTVGVVPRCLTDRTDPDCDELVLTDSMAERKSAMIDRSDALLALPGGLGTCDELFEAWTTRMLGLHAKPVVVLDPDGHFTELLRWVDSAVRSGFIGERSRDALVVARDVDSALDACLPRARRPVRS